MAANPSTDQQVALGNLSVDTAITSAGVVYGVYVDRVASPTQLTLFKMSATNTSEWVNTIPISTGVSSEDPDPVICAGDGSSFYIVCSTTGTVGANSNAGGRDIVLIKVDASGNQLWERQSTVSTAQADTNPYVVYSASNSCVYVSYETEVAAGNKQIVLQKYNTSGTQVWTRTIGSPLNEASSHLSLTSSGEIILSFSTQGLVGDSKTSSGYDIVVMKYNTLGTRVWSAQRAAMNTATGNNIAPVTFVDANSNIFCAYTTTVGSNSGGYNIVLTKLNRAGACLWTRQESAINTTRREDEPSIFVDAYGYVYLSYSSYDVSGISTIQVIKMNGNSGATIWKREFHTGTAMKHLYRSQLSLGSDSTVYVRCLMYKDSTTDIGVLKIQQSAPVTTSVLTAAPPAAPSALTSNGTTLSWTAPAGASLTGYKVYAVRNERYVQVRSVASDVTSVSVASLLPGTNDYVVTAVATSTNESEYSDAVTGVSLAFADVSAASVPLDTYMKTVLQDATVDRTTLKTTLRENISKFQSRITTLEGVQATKLIDTTTLAGKTEAQLVNAPVKVVLFEPNTTVDVSSSGFVADSLLYLPGNTEETFTLNVDGTPYVVFFDPSGIRIDGTLYTTGQTLTLKTTQFIYVAAGSAALYTVGQTSSGIVPCFLGNAPVLTPAGYRKIRSLAAGDLVLAPNGDAVPIQRVKVTRVAAGPATNPYRIAAGQFGAERSLLISPNHKVLVDGELREARTLGLPQEDREGVLEYYNLELVGESLMVVAGVSVESLAHIRRVRISMRDFVASLRARYGNNITNDVIQRCVRTCKMLADGSVEVPVTKKA